MCSEEVMFRPKLLTCGSKCQESYIRSLGTKKLSCKNCTKFFFVSHHHQQRKLYCSDKCSKESRTRYKVSPFKIFARDEFRCKYCGKSSIEDNAVLTLDHIVPQSGDGEDAYENIITCCSVCNSEKQDLLFSSEIRQRLNEIIILKTTSVNITLTKQQALEISQFLSDKANSPSHYPDVSSVRAAVRVRKQFSDSVKDYSAKFQELVDADQNALKEAQEKLKEFETVEHSEEEKVAFTKTLQENFDKTRKEYQDLAITHEKENGDTKITIELVGKFPAKDWKAIKTFFGKRGNAFSIWNLGDKLENIAQIFDEN